MHNSIQSSRKIISKITRDVPSLKTFIVALALVASARTIPSLFGRTGRRNRGRKTSIVDGTSVKIALIPTLLPRVYRYLCHRFGRSSGLAELVSSTFIALLPPSWRIHVVLYATSSALYHSATSSRWRRYLPPVWTLNVLGNAYLIWPFLFNTDRIFPSAYERVILSNSTHYVPSNMPKAELEELLRNATFSKTTPGATGSENQHTYELCSRLHPKEPNCLKNYLDACLAGSLRTGRWVAAVSALPILLSKQQRRAVQKFPLEILKKWLISTLRGTVFITASITTSWAMTCLLQRILPKDCLKRTRWLINASIASLWILVLPAKRRTEISLYVARLAALCAWRAWRVGGGVSIPFGDVLLLALSWVQLVTLQRKGEKISGFVGLAMGKLREPA